MKREPMVPLVATSVPMTDLREDCPCPKTGCELHGRCVECRAKHGAKGMLPRCER
jgi:hypothetical protein